MQKSNGSSLNCVGIVHCTVENFSLCPGIFVVRPRRPDFTTEAQSCKDESDSILGLSHRKPRSANIISQFLLSFKILITNAAMAIKNSINARMKLGALMR